MRLFSNFHILYCTQSDWFKEDGTFLKLNNDSKLIDSKDDNDIGRVKYLKSLSDHINNPNAPKFSQLHISIDILNHSS